MALDLPAARPDDVIDVDVHPVLDVCLGAVVGYMPTAWRKKVEYLGRTPLASSPLNYNFLAGAYVFDFDVQAPPDRTPAEAVAELSETVFELGGASIGQLIAPEAVAHAMQSNLPDLSAV